MIRDISVQPQFIADWEQVPKDVANRVDTLIRQMLDGGDFPRSFHPHKADRNNPNNNCDLKGLHIGYVTRTGQHWRILFRRQNEDRSLLVFERLVVHDKMDLILKEMSR